MTDITEIIQPVPHQREDFSGLKSNMGTLHLIDCVGQFIYIPEVCLARDTDFKKTYIEAYVKNTPEAIEVNCCKIFQILSAFFSPFTSRTSAWNKSAWSELACSFTICQFSLSFSSMNSVINLLNRGSFKDWSDCQHSLIERQKLWDRDDLQRPLNKVQWPAGKMRRTDLPYFLSKTYHTFTKGTFC